ncbi:MAG: stage II sporulation protein R [Firmicutes bacterium]|nr:stage II sporulation protein R [Bacillota bacterium]
MKKTIFLFIGIIITYILIGNVMATNDIIPDEAIRIRVIANSDSEYDQEIKLKVKDTLEYNMYNLLKNTTDLEHARELIKNNLSSVESNIDKILQEEEYKLPFTINFGLNYFPKKEFKGIIYEEGYYESVVVTLGEGLGNNWWCVLFPPLCMLEAEEVNTTDVEYTTLVKTVIDKYF